MVCLRLTALFLGKVELLFMLSLMTLTYNLCLDAQGNERHESVQAALLRVFERYGLPKCINADFLPSVCGGI